MLSKYGVARHIYIPIVKRAVVDYAVGADWTPSNGDVKISKDGGAAANVTNLPAAIAMGNTAVWDFSITSTEMQAAQVVITVSDSATKAVEDTWFMIETYGNASGQHEMDFDTPTIVASSVSALAANVITAASIANDAITDAKVAADVTIASVTGAVGSVTAAVALTAGERNSVADTILDRDMSTGVDSGSPSVRTMRQALRFLRNKWSIAAGTLTVTKEDDSTSSWTAAVTTTAGNPVSTIDPA